MIFGKLLGGLAQSKSAEKAAGAQIQASQAAIEEQRRQFDIAQEMLRPYREAGLTAMGGLEPYQQGGAQAYQQQLALAGLLGPEAEAAAIERIQARPGFQAEVDAAEQALLQRAAATGGLRGGNIQAALAEFRPQMLREAIEQEYSRFGGLSSAGLETLGQLYTGGQASAAGTAGQAMNLGTSVGGLLGDIGRARAGERLAKGAAVQGLINAPYEAAGTFVGLGGMPGIGNLFGGG